MSVDVIIPVYRPDEKLNRLLAALETQTVTPERIIIVHTGEVLSDEPDYRADVVADGDAGRANVMTGGDTTKADKPLRILCKIRRDSFDHGGSRNLGAALSTADVMVFMTQDAVPADEYLLENLMRVLGYELSASKLPASDMSASELSASGLPASGLPDRASVDAGTQEPERKNASGEVTVAAAYARQLPYEDCRAVERYIREFNYPEKSELRTGADLPTRGIKTFCLSNVCAAYRRDLFERLGGFEERTIFNEDMLFGAKAINAGLGVVYAADAKVYHSHNLGLSDQFHRNFDNAVSQAEHPAVFAAVSSEKEGMKLVKYCISRMREDGKLYLVPYFVLNCACRYAGFFLGKRYRKLPKWLVKACSLNKRYW